MVIKMPKPPASEPAPKKPKKKPPAKRKARAKPPASEPAKPPRRLQISGLKIGRPTGYKPEFVERAGRYALLGMTMEEIAKRFEVALSTLYEWMGKHKEFSDAIYSGKDEADSHVVSGLYNRAKGGFVEVDKVVKVQRLEGGQKLDDYEIVKTQVYIPPDTQAGKHWLNNRRRHEWSERVENTLQGPGGGPIALDDADAKVKLAQSALFLIAKMTRAGNTSPISDHVGGSPPTLVERRHSGKTTE